MDLAFLIFKLIFALIVVFGLMYLLFKIGGNKFYNANEGKYI
ncbi:flagellar formation protein, partial [Clostridium perfringens]|nr:flagellar formation protein [Clostridium perfringens]